MHQYGLFDNIFRALLVTVGPKGPTLLQLESLLWAIKQTPKNSIIPIKLVKRTRYLTRHLAMQPLLLVIVDGTLEKFSQPIERRRRRVCVMRHNVVGKEFAYEIVSISLKLFRRPWLHTSDIPCEEEYVLR